MVLGGPHRMWGQGPLSASSGLRLRRLPTPKSRGTFWLPSRTHTGTVTMWQTHRPESKELPRCRRIRSAWGRRDVVGTERPITVRAPQPPRLPPH